MSAYDSWKTRAPEDDERIGSPYRSPESICALCGEDFVKEAETDAICDACAAARDELAERRERVTKGAA